MMQCIAKLMAAVSEPWQSEHTPQQMRQLRASVGFAVEEDLGPMGLNARYLARRRDGLQMVGWAFAL